MRTAAAFASLPAFACLACVAIGSAAGAAESPSPPPTQTLVKRAPKTRAGRLLVYNSFAFNAYTYLGATSTAPSLNLTPADRGIIYQQLGFGYFVLPNLRLTLTLQLGETVTGAPANTNTLSLFAIIPWLVYTTHGFFTGAGPVLAPVSYGKAPNFDAGIYTATGYSFQLGRGWSLSPALQVVMMLDQRFSLALTPTVALAYRF